VRAEGVAQKTVYRPLPVLLRPMPDNLSPDHAKGPRRNEAVRHIPKGVTLFLQGSAAAGVCLLETGEVRSQLPTGAIKSND
jgi:hypothetical protein